MKRSALVAVVLLAAWPQILAAQQHEEHLTEAQQLGRRLYEKSCGVCHTRPTMIAGMYGPELNKNSAGGDEAAMRGVIAGGTPRMPGFKYTYDATQIAAIASYLKTLEP